MRPDPAPTRPAGPPAADDRCPRCGGGFHCGAKDSGPCACSSLVLGTELQQALRQHYSGCLCLACLRALAGGAPLSHPGAGSPGGDQLM